MSAYNFGSSALSQHLTCDPLIFEQGIASNPFLIHNLCLQKVISRLLRKRGSTRGFACGCLQCEIMRVNSGLAATIMAVTNEQQNVEIK